MQSAHCFISAGHTWARRPLLGVLISLMVCHAALLRADDVVAIAPTWDPSEYLLRPSDLVPTTRWLGDGYARGPLSVLVISGDYTSFDHHGRKLVELKRGLNLDMEFALAANFRAEGSREIDDDRIAHLIASRQWDVIALYAMPMGHAENNPYMLIGDANIKAINERVEAGSSGLLIISGRVPDEITSNLTVPFYDGRDVMAGLGLLGRFARQNAVNWTSVQEDYADDYVRTSILGDGVAVIVNQEALGIAPGGGLMMRCESAPFTTSHRIDSDYFTAEFGRLLMYAAQREPEVVFSESPPGLINVAFDATKATTGHWRFMVGGEARDLTVSWRLRDSFGDHLATGSTTLANASGEVDVPFSLPVCSEGSYYLDVFIDSDRGRENYGYSAMRVAAPVSVQATMTHPAFEPGTPITGTLSVSNALPTDRLQVTLWDGDQRRVSTAVLPATAKDFTIESSDLHGIPHCVQVEVLRGERRAGSAWADVNLLHRRQDRFNVVMWGGAVGPYAYWTQKTLKRTGVTVSMDPNGYLGDMAHMPMCGRFTGQWRGEEYVGPGSTDLGRHIYSMSWDPEISFERTLVPAPWNDPQAWQEILGLTDSAWAIGARQPVFVYNLHDEGPYFCADTSPSGMRAYQEWLKGEYSGDLQSLNTEWETQYPRWEDITGTLAREDLEVAGDPWENKARELGKYARWSDRQTFAKINFNNLVLDGFTQRAKAVDPHARIGFEGSGGFGGISYTISDGMVFDDLMTSAGFYCPYDGLHLELIRSLRPPGFLYGFWTGYHKTADPLVSQAWRMVVNGAPAIWWWMLSGTGQYHGWLARDDQPYPDGSGQLIEHCVKPLREGLGDLLINLDQQHDGIAIYHSQAAAHAGVMLTDPAGNTFGTPLAAAGAWHQAIEDGGYQWLYLTKERVLAGELASRNIKLLILPLIQPLGDDEVAELEKFAAAGGTIIADVRPGVLSGHCRIVPFGPADDLFGIQRSGPGTAAPVSGDAVLQIGESSLVLKLADSVADSSLKPTTAQASATINGAPLFMTRTLGAGRVVLLNARVETYQRDRWAESGKPFRDFVRGLVSALGIAPRLRVTTDDGADVTMGEITTWQKGGVSVFSIFEGRGNGVAKLPALAYVFDWRRGPLGQVDEIALDPVGQNHIQFLSAYAYDPGAPVVAVSQPQVKPGETLEFSLSMSGVPADETGTFSYHTRLLDPTGTWVDVIPWSVQGVGGKASIRVRLAFNDPPGAWKLVVREITTGRTFESAFTLSSEAP